MVCRQIAILQSLLPILRSPALRMENTSYHKEILASRGLSKPLPGMPRHCHNCKKSEVAGLGSFEYGSRRGEELEDSESTKTRHSIINFTRICSLMGLN